MFYVISTASKLLRFLDKPFGSLLSSKLNKDPSLPHEAEKKSIRKKLQLERRGVGATERQRKSQAIMAFLLQLDPFRKARTIQLYLSYATEVETSPIFHFARRKNKQIAVPILDRAHCALQFSELNTLSPHMLEKSPLGISQPRLEFQKKIDPKTIDLWIIPGLAFDPQGNRLGYGKGYYDRALQNIQQPVLGLAFEIQIVPHLPVETRDVPVDYIITEKRTIVCKGGRST
ncbi:5-formyltetrahydrofolate cyclo-ligase [hydrothermal vent metagenome]|uniref:5-formyltetrahydrofolate cyclo-ligase n=1 Tax=hydrothermal vent metagenome TaxID=652676 RepID=A0A3B1CXB3_9ZZZZ